MASAADTIEIGGKEVLQFHPLKRKVKDGTVRCFACGQIDEDGWHVAEYCPASGGWLPFPTSTIKVKLKADSGYGCEVESRITLEQWVLIDRIIAGEGTVTREIVDQDQSAVGTANTPVKELVYLESFVDEEGTTWTPPTAWAYYAACQAILKKEARICELLAAQRIETGTAETAGLGPKDESLVANGDAPDPSQHTPENHHDR